MHIPSFCSEQRPRKEEQLVPWKKWCCSCRTVISTKKLKQNEFLDRLLVTGKDITVARKLPEKLTVIRNNA